MRSRVWAALALALVGLSVMVDVWGGVPLNTAGVVLSFISAVTFAAYLLLAEHAVGRRDPVSLLVYGFFFATVFWAIVQPWWSFPFDELEQTVSLLGNLVATELPAWTLVLVIVVLGTIVPFILMVGSLQHLPATTVGMVAMLEPVLGAIVAYLARRDARGPAAAGRGNRARCDLPGADVALDTKLLTGPLQSKATVVGSVHWAMHTTVRR